MIRTVDELSDLPFRHNRFSPSNFLSVIDYTGEVATDEQPDITPSTLVGSNCRQSLVHNYCVTRHRLLPKAWILDGVILSNGWLMFGMVVLAANFHCRHSQRLLKVLQFSSTFFHIIFDVSIQSTLIPANYYNYGYAQTWTFLRHQTALNRSSSCLSTGATISLRVAVKFESRTLIPPIYSMDDSEHILCMRHSVICMHRIRGFSNVNQYGGGFADSTRLLLGCLQESYAEYSIEPLHTVCALYTLL
ncbi:hypothetical protein ABKN59_011155 [Abortiporus biennis]